ncbi:PP2C family protein-serine/threonine phosphatase [Paenibacillus arenilitoris]|uniref:PP2C family protein-serine/threonine phosphatase n=1 Tax=Paenibacillus arenilitoris TaxID=2772299 RepID=A0A927CIB5_9BACL|nr:SpoIIE family protein phosphatase [Paenibacillus arenilitoris]MBD2867597.1 PP2C family protein-serine/threonine phosphatase [Paenibacillus arenilitoris]
MSELLLLIGAAGLCAAAFLFVRNRRLAARLKRAEMLFDLSTEMHASLYKPELLNAVSDAARKLIFAEEAAVGLAEVTERDSRGAGSGDVVSVPMTARGRKLGVLQASSKSGGAPFSEADRELLAKFAEPLALALDNARLYEALEESVNELQLATAQKERLESELQIAGSIQLSFLPTIMPSANEPFDVCALLRSAKEVGGDFYNFFKIDEDHLFFTLGDVSDKGIPAALFMAMTLSLIKGKMNAELSPGELLGKVNDELCTDNAQLFATIVCGVLKISTGEVALSDGGHCTPYVVKADGEVLPVKLPKGIPLGSFPEFRYKDQTIVLAKGDRIVLYTDGITEAENAVQEQYSANRLQSFLSQTSGYSSAEIIDALLMDVFMFADGAPQSDDIAVLCLMRR